MRRFSSFLLVFFVFHFFYYSSILYCKHETLFHGSPFYSEMIKNQILIAEFFENLLRI